MMIKSLIGLLILFWVLGLVFDIAGGLIHVLLVIALVVFVFDFITGRRQGQLDNYEPKQIKRPKNWERFFYIPFSLVE